MKPTAACPFPIRFESSSLRFSDGYKLIREYRGLFALLWCGFVFAFAFSPLAALFPMNDP